MPTGIGQVEQVAWVGTMAMEEPLLKKATAIQLQLTVVKRQCKYFVTIPFIAPKKLELQIFMGNVMILIYYQLI